MKIVVITAYASIDTAVEAMRRGAFDYLPKPFTPDQVAMITKKVTEIRNLEQKVTELQEALARGGAGDRFDQPQSGHAANFGHGAKSG